MLWSKGDGEEVGAMIANVDCIYADVRKRQMPSDERIEVYSMLCKHEINAGGEKKKRKNVTMTGIP